jgi:hypothetical protein
MKREVLPALICILLTVPLLCLCGCVLPYAYPKLSYVHGCVPGAGITDCYAFRVDIAADQVDIDESGHYSLTPIAPRPDGTFPPQTQVSVERGYYILGIALNYSVGRVHTTRLRMYRPGYELVERASWDPVDNVHWKPTIDWSAQEKAIDELVYRPAVTDAEVARRKKPLALVGHYSSLTAGLTISKPVAEFVAAEYDRVAALAPTPAEAARLHGKARQLRELELVPASSATGSTTVEHATGSP